VNLPTQEEDKPANQPQFGTSNHNLLTTCRKLKFRAFFVTWVSHDRTKLKITVKDYFRNINIGEEFNISLDEKLYKLIWVIEFERDPSI